MAWFELFFISALTFWAVHCQLAVCFLICTKHKAWIYWSTSMVLIILHDTFICCLFFCFIHTNVHLFKMLQAKLFDVINGGVCFLCEAWFGPKASTCPHGTNTNGVHVHIRTGTWPLPRGGKPCQLSHVQHSTAAQGYVRKWCTRSYTKCTRKLVA